MEKKNFTFSTKVGHHQTLQLSLFTLNVNQIYSARTSGNRQRNMQFKFAETSLFSLKTT
jgi:hypothetical protein